MPVYSKHLQVDVEKLRDKLLFEEGLKHFRFFKKGKSLIVAIKLTEFKTHLNYDEPVLYIPPMSCHDAPFVIQDDRILVRAKDSATGERLFRSFMSKHLPRFALRKTRELKELIESFEDKHLEFKATFRYDIKREIISKDIERECLKTICAFLNAEGGILIIGISDDHQVIGLLNDFQTFKRKDRDGFENYLITHVSGKIGDGFLDFIRIDFAKIESKVICIIEVLPADKPAFLKDGKEQEFYVRIGNSSRPFSMSDATTYIKDHWK
jgi:hypothetical protein